MNVRKTTRRLRQLSQVLFLLLFLFLFRKTDYAGEDTIPYAVNLFFRWDPLVAASVWLAEKEIVTLLLPSLFVVGLTVIFGRVFCGWICPLGTLLDTTGRFVTPVVPRPVRLRYLKYMILVLLLVSAFLGIQWIGFADPFSILVRGLVFAVDPLLNLGVSAFFDFIYLEGPSWLSSFTEPVYSVLKTYLLPYKQSYFFLAMFSFFFLLFIFLLEFAGKRFWCRNLCPLGALLALISRVSFFRRFPLSACKKCRDCRTECPMEAFTDDDRLMMAECSLCMDCLEYCGRSVTRFRFSLPDNRAGIDFGRRRAVTAGIAGAALWGLAGIEPVTGKTKAAVIRPPGALQERDFLAACVRCGECMKVCIQNALQPLFLEKGVDAMFTPVLVPRLGYCEFNCTLCGQVCPTGAISRLPLEEKHTFVVGKAYIDRNRCLPYALDKPCIVCEEHCPIPDKAIKFNSVQKNLPGGKSATVKQPYVVERLCTGCGICEYMCPVNGPAAIRVLAGSLQGYAGM